MTNDRIMNALFAQQRAQIIYMHSMNSELIEPSYVYAWQSGIYPLLHDGDHHIPNKAHESYPDQFPIHAEFVSAVFDFINERCLEGKPLTFYELEKQFGGKAKRLKLIYICRYMFLNGEFGDGLWQGLLSGMQYPSEAHAIILEYDASDVSLP